MACLGAPDDLERSGKMREIRVCTNGRVSSLESDSFEEQEYEAVAGHWREGSTLRKRYFITAGKIYRFIMLNTCACMYHLL